MQFHLTNALDVVKKVAVCFCLEVCHGTDVS